MPNWTRRLLLRQQTLELRPQLGRRLQAVHCGLVIALGELFLEGGVVGLVVSHGDEADAAHLVFGFFAPGDVNRRTGWVMWIVRRVVPMDLSIEARAGGQARKLFEVIFVLPGKIPI